MTIEEHKKAVRLAFDSLILQCSRELRNLDRFDDARMLVATADIWSAHERAQEAAELLQIAYDMEQAAQQEAE